MVNIIHRIGIKAKPVKVYEAVATTEGIAGWWTKHTSGFSHAGENIIVRFLSGEGKEIGMMNMKIKSLQQNKEVHWKCIEGPEEWIGTDIIFNLVEEGEFTIVSFSHRNWEREVEFTAHCSMKWAVFMLSLRDFVETGKGRPSPDDIKIDNWN